MRNSQCHPLSSLPISSFHSLSIHLFFCSPEKGKKTAEKSFVVWWLGGHGSRRWWLDDGFRRTDVARNSRSRPLLAPTGGRLRGKEEMVRGGRWCPAPCPPLPLQLPRGVFGGCGGTMGATAVEERAHAGGDLGHLRTGSSCSAIAASGAEACFGNATGELIRGGLAPPHCCVCSVLGYKCG